MADFDNDDDGEEITLNSDKITEILDETMKAVLNSVQWNSKKVDQWTSNIIEQCLKRLAEMKKPFKYVVTAVIMQKTGAGVHSAFTAFWDNSADGICYVPYENDTIQCFCTVYGLKLD
eukprot:NODE_14399_length_447_cov_436.898148_g14100_i0.p1 GENE.NODE_14399_length_447_cov_436.898148_g14100_i0~~NODE_14399_length_447_cov_436.898148_g14100_i0.p1  ORF type:complete len:138 (+),score=45.58 NODE_14399_length_447_cov_436.898148_g14100_i0:61-414(+)